MKWDAKVRMRQVSERAGGKVLDRLQVLELMMEEGVAAQQNEVDARFNEMEIEYGYSMKGRVLEDKMTHVCSNLMGALVAKAEAKAKAEEERKQKKAAADLANGAAPPEDGSVAATQQAGDDTAEGAPVADSGAAKPGPSTATGEGEGSTKAAEDTNGAMVPVDHFPMPNGTPAAGVDGGGDVVAVAGEEDGGGGGEGGEEDAAKPLEIVVWPDLAKSPLAQMSLPKLPAGIGPEGAPLGQINLEELYRQRMKLMVFGEGKLDFVKPKPLVKQLRDTVRSKLLSPAAGGGRRKSLTTEFADAKVPVFEDEVLHPYYLNVWY
jgi:hypothetical protein